MSWATKRFGDSLLVKTADKPVGIRKPTTEVLSGKKFVVLYFSAREFPQHIFFLLFPL